MIQESLNPIFYFMDALLDFKEVRTMIDILLEVSFRSRIIPSCVIYGYVHAGSIHTSCGVDVGRIGCMEDIRGFS